MASKTYLAWLMLAAAVCSSVKCEDSVFGDVQKKLLKAQYPNENFTIFAPTDEAFALLPVRALQQIRTNPQAIQGFLLHHIVIGPIPSSNIENDIKVQALRGSPLRLNVYGPTITVNGAELVQRDKKYGANVVHVINKVLYPISSNDLLSQTKQEFNILYQLLGLAGLTRQLSGGPYTLLAPTDDNLRSLPGKAFDLLFSNVTMLRSILLNHVIPGTYYSPALKSDILLEPLYGAPVILSNNTGVMLVNKIPIVRPDITVTNGVIHGINGILLPRDIFGGCKCLPRERENDLVPEFPSNIERESSLTPGTSTKTPLSETTKPYEIISGRKRPAASTPESTPQQPVNQPDTATEPKAREPETATKPSKEQPDITTQPATRTSGPTSQSSQSNPDTKTQSTPRTFEPTNPTSKRQTEPTTPSTSKHPEPTTTHSKEKTATVPPILPRRLNTDTSTTEHSTTSFSLSENIIPKRPNQTKSPPRQNDTVNSVSTSTQISPTDLTDVTSDTSMKASANTQMNNKKDETAPSEISTQTSPKYDENQTTISSDFSSTLTSVVTTKDSVEDPDAQLTNRKSKKPDNSLQNTPIKEDNQKTTKPTPSTEDSQEPTKTTPSKEDSQEPTKTTPSKEDGQEPTKTTPSKEDGQEPTKTTPSKEDGQEPTKTTPSKEDGQEPTKTTPSKEDSQEPTKTTPSKEDGQEPTKTTPSKEDSQEPTKTTPSKEDSQEPTKTTPSKEDSQEPTKTTPSKEDSQEPTKTTPSKEDGQEPTKTTPSKEDGQEPTKTTPSKEDSQEPTKTTPSKEDGQEPTKTTPSKEDSQEPTKTTPSKEDSQEPTKTTPSKDDSQEPTKTTPSKEDSQEPTKTTPSKKDSQEPTKTTLSKEDSQEPTKASASKEDSQEPTKASASKEDSQEPTKASASKEDSQEPTKASLSKEDRQNPTKTTPTNEDSQDSTKTTPSKEGSQGPTKITPSKNKSQDPEETTPNKEDSQDPTETTPSKNGSQNPKGTTPVKNDSEESTKTTPNVEDSQNPKETTPSKEDIQKPTENSPNKEDSQDPTKTTPSKDDDQDPTEQAQTTEEKEDNHEKPNNLSKDNNEENPDKLTPRKRGNKNPPVSSSEKPRGQQQPTADDERGNPNKISPRKIGKHPPNTEREYPSFPLPEEGDEQKPPFISKEGDAENPEEDDETQRRGRTIFEIIVHPGLFIRGNPVGLNIIRQLFEKAGLLDDLKKTDPSTVFLPTDEGFLLLPSDVLNNLKDNPPGLKRFLRHHILSNPLYPKNIQNNMIETSAEGIGIPFNLFNRGKTILVGGSQVLAATNAINGVVYVIDKPMFPVPSINLVKCLANNPGFTVTEPLVTQSGINNLLQDKGPFTMFMPADEAFSRIKRAVLEKMMSNRNVLDDFLMSHIVPGVHFSRAFRNNLILPTLNGRQIQLFISPNGQVMLNGVKVLSKDIPAGNGVVHKIGGVLVLPKVNTTPYPDENISGRRLPDDRGIPTPVDKMDSSLLDDPKKGSANTFFKLLEESGLDEVVNNKENFTVFAPTDNAIASNPSSQNRDLRELLTYHICPGLVPVENMLNEMTVPSLLDGTNIRFNRYQNGKVFTVAGARILGVKDLPNTRIFLIDRVLYVPQGDIYNSVARSPELQNLTRCLQKTGLADLLKGPGPLTLFAPNDAAFGNLPQREFDQLLNDPGKLRDLLRRHMVGGTFYTAGLSSGMKLKATGGNDLTIGDEPDCTTVDGVKISYPDVNCNNGVIHMISHML
ncbi:uncharacterized protein LOC143241675 [Tachypleus tridentatus]|uniref:uncharacterized protein LOC143241675 n=1 Tax=Tachypleus tridentatus TaxID=6853 RepID=UPI003FD369AC